MLAELVLDRKVIGEGGKHDWVTWHLQSPEVVAYKLRYQGTHVKRHYQRPIAEPTNHKKLLRVGGI